MVLLVSGTPFIEDELFLRHYHRRFNREVDDMVGWVAATP